MTRTSRPVKPAGVTGMPAGKTLSGTGAGNPASGKGAKPPPAGPKPKPDRTPAHLPGQPGKGGFTRSVKPMPLPGKSRGR